MRGKMLRHGRVDAALRSALMAQQEFGVAVCDAGGMLTEANPTLETMLEVPHVRTGPTEWARRYRLYQRDGEEFLRPDDLPLVRALRGEPVVDEVITARPSGKAPRYLRCNGSRLYDATGDVAGAVLFVADVTERIVHRNQLDGLRDRLVATLNHELRTPASILKGHIELLNDLRAELPEAAQWSLKGITRSIGRLELVLDMIAELADQAIGADH